MRNARKSQLKNNSKKRQLVFMTVALLLFVYLTFIMIVGDNGLLRYIKLKSERDKMKAENIIIGQQNENISSHIESYDSQPDLFEGIAREYGLTKEGEMIFKFEDKSDE